MLRAYPLEAAAATVALAANDLLAPVWRDLSEFAAAQLTAALGVAARFSPPNWPAEPAAMSAPCSTPAPSRIRAAGGARRSVLGACTPALLAAMRQYGPQRPSRSCAGRRCRSHGAECGRLMARLLAASPIRRAGEAPTPVEPLPSLRPRGDAWSTAGRRSLMRRPSSAATINHRRLRPPTGSRFVSTSRRHRSPDPIRAARHPAHCWRRGAKSLPHGELVSTGWAASYS